MEKQELTLNELTHKLAKIENQLTMYKEIEKQQKALKEQLKTAMENAGVTKWETNNGIKITLVEDTPDEMATKTYYNEVKFQEENQELVNKYQMIKENYKETKEELVKGRKGYVRVTLPKEELTFKNVEEVPF